VVSALVFHAGGPGSNSVKKNSLSLYTNAIGLPNGALIRYSISGGRIHKAINFTDLMPKEKPKCLFAIPLAQVRKVKALKH